MIYVNYNIQLINILAICFKWRSGVNRLSSSGRKQAAPVANNRLTILGLYFNYNVKMIRSIICLSCSGRKEAASVSSSLINKLLIRITTNTLHATLITD